jgi:hypothetical protein
LAEQNEREANKQLDKTVAAEQLAGNRLKQLDAEKRRTEQESQERADILGCLEALFGSSKVKTYEASDTDRFVFVVFKDSNQYQRSVREGFLEQGYGIMEDRLTIVCAGNNLMLSTRGKGGGGGVGPFKHEPLGSLQGASLKFFERPISPAIGRPFTIFQLIIAEAVGSGVTFSTPDLTRDPFDEIEPLPPMGSSKVRITRVTVQLMKVEKTHLRTGGSAISERPKEIKALFEDAIRLSRASGGE